MNKLYYSTFKLRQYEIHVVGRVTSNVLRDHSHWLWHIMTLQASSSSPTILICRSYHGLVSGGINSMLVMNTAPLTKRHY